MPASAIRKRAAAVGSTGVNRARAIQPCQRDGSARAIGQDGRHAHRCSIQPRAVLGIADGPLEARSGRRGRHGGIGARQPTDPSFQRPDRRRGLSLHGPRASGAAVPEGWRDRHDRPPPVRLDSDDAQVQQRDAVVHGHEGRADQDQKRQDPDREQIAAARPETVTECLGGRRRGRVGRIEASLRVRHPGRVAMARPLGSGRPPRCYTPTIVPRQAPAAAVHRCGPERAQCLTPRGRRC